MCPVSNVQTGAIATPAQHPANRLLAEGLAITISTDARTTSATTLEREFQLLADTFGWTSDHEQRCQHNARAAAFGAAVE